MRIVQTTGNIKCLPAPKPDSGARARGRWPRRPIREVEWRMGHGEVYGGVYVDAHIELSSHILGLCQSTADFI
jgi:hypothetical protein